MVKKSKVPELDTFLESLVEDQGTESDVLSSVIEFLKENPDPDDKMVHAFADKNGIDAHEIEAVFYHLASEYVKNMKPEKKLNRALGMNWQSDPK